MTELEQNEQQIKVEQLESNPVGEARIINLHEYAQKQVEITKRKLIKKILETSKSF